MEDGREALEGGKIRMCCAVRSRSIMSDSLLPQGLYVAQQDSLSIKFSKQEYWSGLPLPPPADLPNPGIQIASPTLLLQVDSLAQRRLERANTRIQLQQRFRLPSLEAQSLPDMSLSPPLLSLHIC